MVSRNRKAIELMVDLVPIKALFKRLLRCSLMLKDLF